MHTGEKPFACAHCGKRFPQSSNRTSHQKKCLTRRKSRKRRRKASLAIDRKEKRLKQELTATLFTVLQGTPLSPPPIRHPSPRPAFQASRLVSLAVRSPLPGRRAEKASQKERTRALQRIIDRL